MKLPRLLLLAVLALSPITFALAAESAGDVLLSVGTVWVEANGQRSPLVRGQQIDVGQKIVTRDGGHVHIRMKDGGLVAIRPNSIFEIQVFDYNPNDPKAGKVRYSLLEGVARSVTGAIGEANKEAFRFNTPVAAIGVRGTDFVTFSDAGTTRVSVKSGAVIVAALGDSCRAEAFGACIERAIGLHAGNDQSYIEVNRQDKIPRLLQSNPLLQPNQISPPHPAEPVATLQERRVARVDDAAKQAQTQQQAIVQPPAVQQPNIPSVVVETGAKDVYWGRWSEKSVGVTGETVQNLLAAQKNIDVVSTLFGLGVTKRVDVLPERWQAEFQLTGGDAYVQSNGVYSPATLAGGSLKIDMATQGFTAHANVKEGLNTHSVDAAGEADWRGYLVYDPSRSNSRFVGIVNGNLNTVGSVFDKSLEDGRTLNGTMVWHR